MDGKAFWAFERGDGVAYGHTLRAGDGHDVPGMGFGDFNPLHPAKHEYALHDVGGELGVAAQQGYFVSQPECAVGDPSDSDLSKVAVVVERRNKHLQWRAGVPGRRRHGIEDSFEEGLHVRPRLIQVRCGVTSLGRCIEHGEIQLLRIGSHLQEKVLDHLYHLSHPCLGSVYLVDDHHGGDVLL